MEDVGLGLLRGVGQEGEGLTRLLGVDRAHAVGTGDQQLVDDRVVDDRPQLADHRVAADAGPLGRGRVGRQQSRLGDHVPADLVLDRGRHVLREGDRASEHGRDAVAARAGLLEDRPPGGERLEDGVDGDDGQHQERCHDRDPAPKRHARSPRAAEAGPSGNTSARAAAPPPAGRKSSCRRRDRYHRRQRNGRTGKHRR